MSATALAHDEAAAIRKGSSSFALASRLLPADTRRNARLLYAWCRHCDDAIDGQEFGRPGAAGGSGHAFEELLALSTAAMNGADALPRPFDGLARVMADTGLPRYYVLDHLRGFELDAAGHRCRTLADTLLYCYHVAGAVGLMMAWIMGVREDETLTRGCDLGIAFQLTNIARDVDEDARVGRIYLPSDWLEEAGVRIEAGRALDPIARKRIVPVVARLLDEAERHYAAALPGIRHLPPRSAWAIATARHVYRDIGHELRRRGEHAWADRVATSTRRKWQRVLQAMGETAWSRF